MNCTYCEEPIRFWDDTKTFFKCKFHKECYSPAIHDDDFDWAKECPNPPIRNRRREKLLQR